MSISSNVLMHAAIEVVHVGVRLHKNYAIMVTARNNSSRDSRRENLM